TQMCAGLGRGGTTSTRGGGRTATRSSTVQPAAIAPSEAANRMAAMRFMVPPLVGVLTASVRGAARRGALRDDPPHRVIEDEGHDCADRGDEEAPEVEPGDAHRAERVEQPSADEGADDPEDDVEDDALTAVV